MEWLTQNWLWVALIAGVAIYFVRPRRSIGQGGHGGGCCSGHDGRHSAHAADPASTTGKPKDADLQPHETVSTVVR